MREKWIKKNMANSDWKIDQHLTEEKRINTYQTPCGTEKQGIKKDTRNKKTNLTRKGENEHVSQKNKVAPLSVRRSVIVHLSIVSRLYYDLRNRNCRLLHAIPLQSQLFEVHVSHLRIRNMKSWLGECNINDPSFQLELDCFYVTYVAKIWTYWAFYATQTVGMQTFPQ